MFPASRQCNTPNPLSAEGSENGSCQRQDARSSRFRRPAFVCAQPCAAHRATSERDFVAPRASHIVHPPIRSPPCNSGNESRCARRDVRKATHAKGCAQRGVREGRCFVRTVIIANRPLYCRTAHIESPLVFSAIRAASVSSASEVFLRRRLCNLRAVLRAGVSVEFSHIAGASILHRWQQRSVSDGWQCQQLFPPLHTFFRSRGAVPASNNCIRSMFIPPSGCLRIKKQCKKTVSVSFAFKYYAIQIFKKRQKAFDKFHFQCYTVQDN